MDFPVILTVSVVAFVIFVVSYNIRYYLERRRLAPAYLNLLFVSSIFVGAVFCTGLSMVCIVFTSEARTVGQPFFVLPKILTVHLGLAGLVLIFGCFILMAFICTWTPQRLNITVQDDEGDFLPAINPPLGRIRRITQLFAREEPSQPETIELSALHPNYMVGPYKLVKQIGSGAFADVWECEKDSQSFALKIPRSLDSDGNPTGLVNDETIRQAQSEAKTWNKAVDEGHKNVMKVIDAQTFPLKSDSSSSPIGELFVIAMEYCPDGSLRDLIRNEDLPPDTALAIALQILDGLSFLHEQNLIHRDMKPANVMMRGSTPLICDFGLARFADDNKTVTVKGTMDYMSPEAIRGDRSPANDIWAVAVILYEMLHKTTPFDPPNQWNLSFANSVPPIIQELLRRALHKDKTERIITAADLAEQISLALFAFQEPSSSG